MPRKPIGETAMTDAERQARYRAARAAANRSFVCIVRTIIAAGPVAGPTMSPASWKPRSNMPPGWTACRDNLQDGATAEALRAICDLDLTELQAIEPPRGFGRD